MFLLLSLVWVFTLLGTERPFCLTQQLIIFIFRNKYYLIYENLAERFLLFFPGATGIPAFSEVPGAAAVLVILFSTVNGSFMKNIWRRLTLPGAGIPWECQLTQRCHCRRIHRDVYHELEYCHFHFVQPAVPFSFCHHESLSSIVSIMP